MMKIFEYAILHHSVQTKDQLERGEKAKSTLIVDVSRVVAETEAEVQILAARAIPAEFTDKLDQVEVAIRPF